MTPTVDVGNILDVRQTANLREIAMQAATFDSTARDRAIEHPVRVTFAHGRCLTEVVHLSAAGLETWLRDGEITADAHCVTCGEHVSDCPDFGHLLLDWPDRTYSTCWSAPGTPSELGLEIVG